MIVTRKAMDQSAKSNRHHFKLTCKFFVDAFIHYIQKTKSSFKQELYLNMDFPSQTDKPFSQCEWESRNIIVIFCLEQSWTYWPFYNHHITWQLQNLFKTIVQILNIILLMISHKEAIKSIRFNPFVMLFSIVNFSR